MIITREMLIAGLRDEDPEVRGAAAHLLALSIGVGLRVSGAGELDAAFGVGRDVCNLIEAAVAGDELATQELEKILTTDQNRAARTPQETTKECSK